MASARKDRVRTRILYLSPLPPARTGIATYSATVLAQLRAMGFGASIEAPWPLGGRIDELARASDLAVYHVGNNAEFHGEIYRLAVRHPGLVVLHDLGLDDLAAAFLAAGDPLGMRARAEAEAAEERLVGNRPDIEGPLETPWCAHLVRRARGVVVHSSFGREYLEAFGSRTPVFVVPHPVIEAPRAARRAIRGSRAIRDRLSGSAVVGVLGDIGAAKRIDVVLAAVARIEAPIHVAVVGRRIPGYELEEVIRASGLGERVTVAADVTDAVFYAWLHACDVVVNLRHPHRGEVSGTLVRALEAGKPVVVQAEGSYLDLPEDVVVRIGGGRPSVEELATALDRLVRDPGLRAAVGGRAGEHVRRLRLENATAAGYAEAIERTLALVGDPARLAAERWAVALAGLGATEETAGLGTGYVQSLEQVARSPVPGVTSS